MKRKFLLPILSVCMVVALVSVGFAAWLITGNDTSDTATGNFVTYDVENDYFTVTVDPATGETGTIVFGKPASETTTPALEHDWFKFDDATDVEKLTATFTVTIRPDVPFDTSASVGRDVAKLLGANNVQVTLDGLADDQIAATENTTAKLYAAAVDKGIVVLPTWNTVENKITPVAGGNMTDGISVQLAAGAFTIAGDKTKATATVTVTFAWGKYGNDSNTAENPYFHFNRTPNGSDIRTAAMTALTTLHKLNTATYRLRLAVVPATPAA